ncbi:MAG: S8 family peptidase [Ignavibacteria bacterium]|nr:S8 family peptidase [Ignavibacteria bacterium]
MKKIFFFLIMFCGSIPLFAQNFEATLDNDPTTIVLEGENANVKKYLLYAYCDTVQFLDTNHMSKLIDQLESINCKIFRVYLNDWMDHSLINFYINKGIETKFLGTTSVPGAIVVRISDEQNIEDAYNSIIDGTYIIGVDYYPILRSNSISTEPSNPADPNDLYFTQQWNLKQSSDKDIDADKAWWITKGDNTKVAIFIIDTGIRLTGDFGSIDHQDFDQTYIKKGHNYTHDPVDQNVRDVSTTSHGTLIAGIIGATQNNNWGISGIAPKCEIFIDKADGDAFYFVAALENAINYKNTSLKSVVVSISTEWDANMTRFKEQIDRAESIGVMVVCAAGNHNTTVKYPAKYAHDRYCVISVGATDNTDTRTNYSNYANLQGELILMAPSGKLYDNIPSNPPVTEYIKSTLNTGYSNYSLTTGTSMSAPMVAASIALMYSAYSPQNPHQIYDHLKAGCDNKPSGGYTANYGYGRLNAFNSIVESFPINSGTSGNPYVFPCGTIPNSFRVQGYAKSNPVCTTTVSGKTVVIDKNATWNIDPLSKIWVRNNGRLIQRANSSITGRYEITVDAGSYFCLESGANLLVGGQGNQGPNDRGCIMMDGGGIILEDNTNLNIDLGGFMIMRNQGTLVLGDNSNITFDNGGFLSAQGGSKIVLGENSSLTFNGNSYFKTVNPELGHVEIYSSNGSKLCEGLKFINSYNPNTSISNCIFTNCKKPITIINDNSSAFIPKVIQGNTFNLPEGGANCIYAEKAFSIKIDGNTFNMPTSNLSSNFGVYIKNSPISELEEAPLAGGEIDAQDPSTRYQATIINNNFKGGTVAMGLWNYSSMLRCYVYNNTFTNVGQVSYGMLSRQITGDIKNNTFASTNYNTPMYYHQSTVNLFANDLKSNNIDLFLNTGSSVRMAPIPMNGNFLWFGGQNKISSVSADNINLNSYCDLFLDYGANCFSKPNNNQKYNVFGYTNNSELSYLCRGNSWSPGSTPNIKLWNNAGFPITGISYAPTTVCNENIESDAFEVSEEPFDVIDTLYTSVDNSGNSYAADEMLLAEGVNFYYDQFYTDAINSSKNYIDAYPEKKECTDCLTQLYECYIGLDTSVIDNQYRDGLYSNLKIYLTDKINSGLYSVDFNDLAYSFTLICDSYIGNYTDAMDGYLFIAAYHPDPETRLLAGWDAVEIAALMGEGEGSIDNKNTGWENIENGIFENAKQDPIKTKMKATYEKVLRSNYMKELNLRGEKTSEASMNSKTITQVESDIFTDKQKQIVERTKNILGSYKSLSKEERIKQQTNDMLHLLGNGLSKEADKPGLETVSSFSLSQNYPNPFNPTTNIKFALPKAGFVSLKVFDVTGRMIKELVSEFKETGNYSVVFDGAGISSGVYFYKLETSNFIDTKRMVLVK